MMRIFSYLFSFLVLGLGTVSAQGVISLTDLKQEVKGVNTWREQLGQGLV